MQIKRFFSLLIALAMLVSGVALAEQIDAEARIAELEAQVEELTQELEEAQATIRDYEEQAYVVTFDGGFVSLEEAKAQYDYVVSMYQAYGYSISGYEDYIRQDLLKMLAEEAVVNFKAREMGYAELDAETLASYEQEAASTHESYVNSYMTYFAQDGASEEETLADTEAYLESIGYSYDGILQSMIETHAQQALFEGLTGDVAITEDDVKAAYDEVVAADETTYADSAYDYESVRTDGGAVYWNPEGYRQVKHILIKFDDDQAARYSELRALADDLESRIEAANAPAEEAVDAESAETEPAETDAEPVDAESEPAEGDAEPAEAGEAAEAEEAEPVDVAELEAQLTGTMDEIEALYQELMPRAEEVVSRFEAGESFDDLIAEYNEDPGMESEPGKSEGYYVCADSKMWDPAFTAGAMSIEAVGGISEPVFGSYGIHIIYYLADTPAGPVDYEAVRADLEEHALTDKKNDIYNSQVSAWMDELHVEYHLDRFK